MRLTRSIAQKLNTPIDNIRIEFEDDGVCRLTTGSLTGKGTHTKWFYPEGTTSISQRKGGEDRQGKKMEYRPKNARDLAACAAFNPRSEGSSPAMSSRQATPALEDLPRHANHQGGRDMDICSDSTELLDEVGEAEELKRLERSREEKPLPDLPYDRIMRRISLEATVILDDAYF
ncbi:hypothetical protein P691DRAFT_800527 [Macrolepiota fuliginosa MF-IS2]|uniref:Uncharacterized protein n=1 Tax=Macrolepiota fuliginosa MF-IS2 TaxID=1400762 RepID=A0A9P5XC11_9AGAR|nr:hypothetical protein P691DRAFT_800527 [Macrolepiota fuliginosa MF-IS2]